MTARPGGYEGRKDLNMSIREQAKRLGFEIIGRLTRRPDWERSTKERAYIDDAGNEYYTWRGILTIVTANGGVI